MLYDLNLAATYVWEWMRHIMRSAHTQYTESIILEELTELSCFLIGDWMMKILLQHFREKMEDWFGKTGISGHVHSFIMRSGTAYRKATYFTFLDKCKQDVFTTQCIFEQNLKAFHEDFPHIKTIHCRNDNATCYSGASALFAKKEICEKIGLELSGLDFNEAQKGKDQCDRDGALAKNCIRTFVNNGNDVLKATDVKFAPDNSVGALNNSMSAVISVDSELGSMEKAKISDVSRYHYFDVEEEGFRAWEFWNIGEGKMIPYQQVNFHSSYENVLSFEKQYRKTKSFMTSSKKKVLSNSLFCTDKDCTSVLPNEEALEQHLLLQDHSYFSKPEDLHKTSDKVKILFAQKLKDAKFAEHDYLTSSIGNDCTSTSGRNGESVHHFEDGKTMGWALRKRRKNTRFSEKQICFLVDIYEEGEKNEKKERCSNCC